MGLKVTGLDELNRKLTDLADRAEALDGKHTVSLTDLLTPEFIAKHTKFTDADAMFATSGFKLDTNEDLEAIPDADMDSFIASVSDFATWRGMLDAAAKAWTVKRLGL